MQERIDKIIRAVYRSYKADNTKEEAHPDEETMACFLENRLSQKEAAILKEHLISCASCAEIIAVQMRMKPEEAKEVPLDLVERVKKLVAQEQDTLLLEIFLKLKEKAWEILSTTGDILVGQELMPAPVLRSRNIKDFKDEVTILKDFPDVRVEAKIISRPGKAFDLTVAIRDKKTQSLIKDLRITLLRDDTELESYVADAGLVTFEHVAVGRYTVNISMLEERVAYILIDIKL